MSPEPWAFIAGSAARNRVQHTEQVGLDHTPPPLGVARVQGAVVPDARVGDHEVEAAERLGARRDRMLDGPPGTDVGLAGDGLTLKNLERAGGLGRNLSVHVGQDDPGSVPDELGRAPEPDPAARTGHDTPADLATV